jgi:exopolyphosphatase / guanosine-5'-triphosphate,3'-diphosphate pyrophosphatase
MPSYILNSQAQTIMAAIDLGSNALRALIVRKDGKKLTVLRNMRMPLRLGEDVFATGRISEQKMQMTEDAFILLLHVFAEYNVTEIRAMATSAMRDAKNGKILQERIERYTGIQIETISGNEEAQWIFAAVEGQLDLRRKNCVLMDIGGGSTELTILKHGELISTHSFNIGTVRLLRYKDQQELEVRIRLQLQKMLRFIRLHLGNKSPQLFIGTGGNLRRIGKIRKKMLGKDSSEVALFQEIHHMQETIFSMSYVDRIRQLELDQNRADVILPAIMLTSMLMEKLKMKKIHLPKVGLKEGIILSMLPEPPKIFLLKD